MAYNSASIITCYIVYIIAAKLNQLSGFEHDMRSEVHDLVYCYVVRAVHIGHPIVLDSKPAWLLWVRTGETIVYALSQLNNIQQI